MNTGKKVNELNTPLYGLGKLGSNDLYIKREDMIPYSFGGNKARKGLLFFRDIDEGDYDCVVTYGSSHSNHCRVIANMAAGRGMPCYIIGPKEVSEETYNSRLIRLMGAESTYVEVERVHDTIEAKLAQLRAQGHKPYFIMGGGHGNIGSRAYVDCYREIRNYELRENMHFDYIFFASGTGTTHAGLVLGQLETQSDCNIIGISIARKNPRGRDTVIASVREYLEENKDFGVKLKGEELEKQIEEKTIFLDDYTGEGYGKNSHEIAEVIKEALFDYGVPLDSTYTGKAFLGMKKYLKENAIENKKILFIHTGGTPLFFDDLKEL